MVQQLSFQDIQGQELALIRQKLLAWGPTYEIYRDNGLFAVVKQELFTFFNCWFTVDVPGPDDLEAKGGFTPTTNTNSGGSSASGPPSRSSGLPGATPARWRSSGGKTTF